MGTLLFLIIAAIVVAGFAFHKLQKKDPAKAAALQAKIKAKADGVADKVNAAIDKLTD